MDAIGVVLREAITDYVRAIEDTPPADLLVHPAPSTGSYTGSYQNLGVFGFKVQDISTANYVQLRASLRPSFRGQFAKIARQAIESASDTLHTVTQTYPSLPQALTLALLTVGEHDLGAHMQAERLAYVLGRGTTTARAAVRAQQPRIVILWIGDNDVLSTMCNAYI